MSTRKRTAKVVPKVPPQLADDPQSDKVAERVAAMPQNPHTLQDFGADLPVDVERGVARPPGTVGEPGSPLSDESGAPPTPVIGGESVPDRLDQEPWKRGPEPLKDHFRPESKLPRVKRPALR